MGRPKLKNSKFQTSITISHRDADFLREIGRGKVSTGIENLISKSIGVEEKIKEDRTPKKMVSSDEDIFG